ncbi:MAG TPA: hypothetical protein VM733_18225 [Thermoanaerobaculia bacterium]|nr:hypothetical protein [Thermoanaerobaculia bacterium]
MSPEFPIRIITDDGECEVIESPEELIARLHDVDSSDSRVWIRDVYDRTVKLVMRGGMIETFEV